MKGIIIKTVLAFFVVAASNVMFPATANADIWCDIMAENPTVSQAEDMIVATALSAIGSGADTDTVGRMVAQDIVTNCPQYVDEVLAAAENFGS